MRLGQSIIPINLIFVSNQAPWYQNLHITRWNHGQVQISQVKSWQNHCIILKNYREFVKIKHRHFKTTFRFCALRASPDNAIQSLAALSTRIAYSSWRNNALILFPHWIQRQILYPSGHYCLLTNNEGYNVCPWLSEFEPNIKDLGDMKIRKLR